jgi:hypothetical protein
MHGEPMTLTDVTNTEYPKPIVPTKSMRISPFSDFCRSPPIVWALCTCGYQRQQPDDVLLSITICKHAFDSHSPT